MRKLLKNYLFTILLLAGIIAGGVCGLVIGTPVLSVRPVGDLFLNLLFVLVVPLVFFSTSASICRLTRSGRVGRVLGSVTGVFALMYVVASVITYLVLLAFNPLHGVDPGTLLTVPAAASASGAVPVGDAIVSTLTVPDFPMLLSKSNLLALIVFSALFGAGTALSGDKGAPVAALLDGGTQVVLKVLDIVMYLAPVCLGCYFACMVADIGAHLIGGYLRTFVEYCEVSLLIFFVINPLYVLMARGRTGVRRFWSHILPPTVTSLATASSAASLPSNIEAAKRMGVRGEIADTVVALGTNIHKDGSAVAGVFKVVFALVLTGQSIATGHAALQAVGIAVLAALATGAVASGGYTGELLICSLMGLDPHMAGILIIVGTIVDIPSTVINVTSNTVAAVVTDRLVQESPAGDDLKQA